MEKEWWRDAVIYQIYPRSFRDSNDDGIGDLQGIIEKLPYLADLGVDAIWISPIYPSPAFDAGYDVSDYEDIDPSFGTMQDFDELLSGAHTHELKVIIDLVPNHTSWSHRWFQEALGGSPGSRARSRYLFRYSENPPNNWGSMFGGSAWTRVQDLTGKAEDQRWWYLHLFAKQQPDLNWENPEVQEYFLSILRFWLDKGVDGFRVDVAHGLFKDPGYPDDALGLNRWEFPDANGPYTNQPYYDRDEVHDVYRKWRHLLDRYSPQRVMVGEVWVRPRTRAAAYARSDEMHQVFNFDFLHCPFDAKMYRQIINESMQAEGSVGASPTWVLANHDQLRSRTRMGYPPGAILAWGVGETDPQPDWEIGLKRSRAAALMMLALPGSAYIFQGEELGLPDFTTMPDSLRQDPTWERSNHLVRGRDSSRVPLPWESGEPHYGFTKGQPWLPQPHDWEDLCADVQAGDPNSTLQLYREALQLRREMRLGRGEFSWDEVPPRILGFSNGSLHCWMNASGQGLDLPTEAHIILASGDNVLPENSETGAVTLAPNATVWFGTEATVWNEETSGAGLAS